ncbi:NUDIX hydrolase [Roseovarius spongiae]|uniref:NUDIX hydrolase n=1 Tax=Roseovarius spongiae TaxID=2320272 RepID=A0A3A8B8I0_9RHOB|nr:NUDIX hydrolase [Roseovarius spongiae]RKF13846.1 NUDIX hydrolase [Roseovarius spongiae]
MPIRLAVRAVIVRDSRLLLVNAYPGDQSDLWCAPGGGVEPHEGLAETLARELREEIGLRVNVGAPCLVNEFHAPASGLHQVEVFFRCDMQGGALPPRWRDPAGVVNRHGWFTRAELAALRLKPDSLPRVAFSDDVAYDALETLVR